jgi:hypothetical protein
VQILAGGEIYQIEAENGDRGYYLKEMVTDQRTSPPDVEFTVVRLDPNAAIIYHPQNSPLMVKEENALEELPPMGMPVFGQFYSIGFGLPIQHARLDPFWAVNFNAPEFLGCGSSAAPLLPPGGLPPPTAWREGNPCREYVDELGRPLLSVSFPLFPHVPARHGNVGFRFIEGRTGDEQRLVSGPYNHVTGCIKMHASHLSRHGHCGSPWRTNLTPASDTCNVKLIGQFEGPVMGRMGECYGTGGTIDLADPGQAVLV